MNKLKIVFNNNNKKQELLYNIVLNPVYKSISVLDPGLDVASLEIAIMVNT
jgi:hypothetical protein